MQFQHKHLPHTWKNLKFSAIDKSPYFKLFKMLNKVMNPILGMFCQKIIQFNNKQQNSSKFNLKTLRTQCWCGNVFQTLYTLLWIPHSLGENSLMCLYVIVSHHWYLKIVGFIHITHAHCPSPSHRSRLVFLLLCFALPSLLWFAHTSRYTLRTMLS